MTSPFYIADMEGAQVGDKGYCYNAYLSPGEHQDFSGSVENHRIHKGADCSEYFHDVRMGE